jgi:hypothetical protein
MSSSAISHLRAENIIIVVMADAMFACYYFSSLSHFFVRPTQIRRDIIHRLVYPTRVSGNVGKGLVSIGLSIMVPDARS